MVRLEEATCIATAGAAGGKNLGPRLEANRIREVFWIKFLNRAAGTNNVQIHERASGGSPKVKDVWSLLLNDTVAWPDELKENSLPLYTIRTDTASVKYMRATCDGGGAFIRMLFRDLP